MIQTFLPYADFRLSAEVLDNSRLGKQRVETLQIMQVLTRHRTNPETGAVEPFEPKGWRTHPAVLMWQGYEPALAAYQEAVCHLWTDRGFQDTCLPKTLGLLRAAGLDKAVEPPPWLGDVDLHRSHQSNLVRKHPERYAELFPDVPDDLPYYWPVAVERGA